MVHFLTRATFITCAFVCTLLLGCVNSMKQETSSETGLEQSTPIIDVQAESATIAHKPVIPAQQNVVHKDSELTAVKDVEAKPLIAEKVKADKVPSHPGTNSKKVSVDNADVVKVVEVPKTKTAISKTTAQSQPSISQQTSEAEPLKLQPTADTDAEPIILPELSDELKSEIARLSNTSTEGLKKEVRADGSVYMDLQGRFQSVPIAVIDNKGKVHVFMHGEGYQPGVLVDEKEKVNQEQKTGE